MIKCDDKLTFQPSHLALFGPQMKNYAKTNAKILKLSQKSVKWVKFHQFWCNLSFVIHVSSLSGKSWNNGRLWLTQYQVTNTKACHYYGKKTWICWFEDKPITICFTCSSSWKPKKNVNKKSFHFSRTHQSTTTEERLE